jgi:hypothetical protein
MTSFALKVIALASMIVDHTGIIFFPGVLWLRVIGRMAFPIFAYLAAEGGRHTRGPVKYVFRLGVFAVISQIPFYMAFHRGTVVFSPRFAMDVSFTQSTNILYTIFLGVLACCVMKGLKRYFSGIKYQLLRVSLYTTVIVAAALAAEWMGSEYGVLGVLMIALAYLAPGKWGKLAVLGAGCAILYTPLGLHMSRFLRLGFYGASWPNYGQLLLPASIAALLLLAFYNGKRGRGVKWLFYFAYPLHIALLMGISAILMHSA